MTRSHSARRRAPSALLLLCLVLLQVLSPFLHLHDQVQQADAPLDWHVLVSDVALPAAGATAEDEGAWDSPGLPAPAAIIMEVGTAASPAAPALASPPLLPYYLLALVLAAGFAALLPPLSAALPRPGVRSPLSPRAPPRA